MIDIIKELVDFDTRTLLGVLFWGSLTSFFVVFIFLHLQLNLIEDKSQRNKAKIQRLARLRLFSAIGYLFLFLRGSVPDLVSVNMGNTLIFICYYYESVILLSFLAKQDKVLLNVLKVILAFSILVFNTLEFIYADSAIRILSASIIIFAIFLLPTIKLLTNRADSRFKHGVGAFYVFLLIALVPRIIMAIKNPLVTLHSNEFSQTVFLLALIMIMISSSIAFLLFLKEDSDKVIEHLAMTDMLTDVENRYSFFQKAQVIFDRQKTRNKPVILLFFDIDDLKMINDKYGHQLGDDILVCFSSIVKKKLRNNDIFGRYGGDEFLLMLSDEDDAYIDLFCSEIMHELKHASFEIASGYKITISTGITIKIPDPDETLDDFILKSDQALYKAKHAGKNQVYYLV